MTFRIVRLFILTSFVSGVMLAERPSALEEAVLALPPYAVADMPLNDRQAFLKDLREDTPKNKRLDIKNRFLEFYSDGETPFFASSMLYVKALRRNSGEWIVFCHMPKPRADGKPARLGQTFVFERRGKAWIDVTTEVMPREIDLKWYFQPRRTKNIIEAGSFDQEVAVPGGTSFYRRQLDLVWDGTRFKIRRSPSAQFAYDAL